MKLTKALRDYLEKHHSLAADASDDAVRDLAMKKLMSGDLLADKLAELTKATEPTALDKLNDSIDARIKSHIDPLKGTMDQILAAVGGNKSAGGAGNTTSGTAVLEGGSPLQKQLAGLGGDNGGDNGDPHRSTKGNGAGNVGGGIDHKALGGAPGAGGSVQEPRVKRVDELFSKSRQSLVYPEQNHHGMRHPLAGLPVKGWDGAMLQTKSDFDLAVCGAYFKMTALPQLARVGLRYKMSDLDQQLIEHALHEMEWTGHLQGRKYLSSLDDPNAPRGQEVHGMLKDWMRKDIVDDATSGGLEAAPVVFDEKYIEIPLLYGELAPFVEMVDIARGRRIEGVTFSNPTINSGPAEDGSTAITLETTTDFIQAMDTTVFNATGAIRIGLDWEEDTPIAFGEFITRKFGEAFKVWLDKVIAIGNGSTEPLGMFNATGTNAIPSVNGTGGPLLLMDVENLIFGIQKQYRNAKSGRNAFVGNDTTYRRNRGIPTGSDDARRIFGMDYTSYNVAGYPYKIQNDISNVNQAFINMAYYRLYRRKGFHMRLITEGQTLGLLNEMLWVGRARYGGRLTAGAAMAEMNTAPAASEF